MLDRLDYSAENCSLMRTLHVVGGRWGLLVLREALLGLRRFDDFARVIGCARNILAARLARFVEHGILTRVPYREPRSRARDEYQLTDKGRDLAVGVAALMQWGDRHLADPAGAPIDLRHRGCGLKVRAILACDAHGEIAPLAVETQPGPAAVRIA